MQTEGEGGGDISWFVTIEAWLKSTCCKYGRPAVLDCRYLPVEARYASASRLRFPGAALGTARLFMRMSLIMFFLLNQQLPPLLSRLIYNT